MAMFEAYAMKLAEAKRDVARSWVTFNEPNLLVYGYMIDLDGDPELKRRPTESTRVYRDIIALRAVPIS